MYDFMEYLSGLTARTFYLTLLIRDRDKAGRLIEYFERVE